MSYLKDIYGNEVHFDGDDPIGQDQSLFNATIVNVGPDERLEKDVNVYLDKAPTIGVNDDSYVLHLCLKNIERLYLEDLYHIKNGMDMDPYSENIVERIIMNDTSFTVHDASSNAMWAIPSKCLLYLNIPFVFDMIIAGYNTYIVDFDQHLKKGVKIDVR